MNYELYELSAYWEWLLYGTHPTSASTLMLLALPLTAAVVASSK